MGMEILGNVATKALLPLAGKVAETVRRLRAERQGALAPAQVRTDLLDSVLKETLNRLQGGSVDDGWWRSVLNAWEQTYVAPDFFRKPTVHSWLELADVEDGFLAIAKAHVLGQEINDEAEIRARLAENYSERTGEAARFAEEPIDVVVATLAAGYFASIPQEQRSLAGMLQAGHNEVIRQIKQIGGRVDRVSTVDVAAREALEKITEEELSAILALRMFDLEGTVARVRVLWQRVEQGDLAMVPERARNSVCYWATRLLASSTETVANARQLREELPDAYGESELRIVDALLKATEGDEDGAIQMLRDVACPSARSVLFGLLHRVRGPEAALQWFEDVHPSTNPDYFEDTGWRKWGFCLARSGRWEEAAEGLRVLAQASSWVPALAMLEGTVNAALLLPAERRGLALEGLPTYMGIRPNLEDGAKERHSRAVECFTFVDGNLPALAGDRMRESVASWRSWLELMDPDADGAARGRRNVQARLEEKDRGVGLVVSLAWAFGIDFDGRALREELEKREQFGGLVDEEVFAECLLNQSTMGPREVAAYVEKRSERLDRVLGTPMTTVMLFEALLADDQSERARTVFEARRDLVVDEVRKRMEVALHTAGGGDPREQLEALYKDSNELIDLRNLIDHLKTQEDWTKVKLLVRELFAREPTLDNAYEVVGALSRPSTDHPSVVAFLEENPRIVAQSDDMKSALAWGLFHGGQIGKSRAINDGLLNARTQQNDLSLDVNIAVATGDWERLSSIVDREWRRRTKYDAEVLMMLARLASQGGQSSERAVELARLATEKEPEDPRVLIAAHGIHVELGRDEDADPQWLARALEHSSEEGPIWAADYQKIANYWLPRMRERNEDIERKLLDGALPIVLAAGALNTPVSRILLDERPMGDRDGRRRPLIPIVSGTRNRTDVEDSWTVGLDVTSIMVLARLSLLDAALEAFGHVKMAPDIMGCLFAERAEARFHQPVRVELAKRARRLLERGRIKVIQRSAVPARKLADEVGADLAVLLEASREENGVAVCARPIHKVGSLMLETADTSAYDDLIVSPADLCVAARRSGRIDKDQHDRAMTFMTSQEQTVREGLSPSILDGPIHVDGLALSYLQSARVLEQMANSGLDLRVHDRVVEETNAFVDAGEAGDDLAEAIEAIRDSLRSGMESGKVSLLPRPPERSENGLGSVPNMSSIKGLLFGCGACDALCVDDRFINSHPASEDPSGKSVLVVCVLDVLRYLRSRGVIEDADYWGDRHRLREAGFAFVPVEVEELLTHLLDAEIAGGRVLESAELRTIRQTVNRFDASGLLKGEEARTLSEGLAMASVRVVKTLWADESINKEAATALATWVWRHLPVAAHLVRNEPTGAESPTPFEDLVSRRVGMLLMAPPMAQAERRSAYRVWLERSVLRSLRTSSPEIVEHAASEAWSIIRTITEHRQMLGAAFLDALPEDLQQRMMRKDPELASDCGLASRQVLQILGRIRVGVNDLVESAVAVFGGGGEVGVVGLEGPDPELTLVGDGPELRWIDKDGNAQRVAVPELTLVCSNASARVEALRRILCRLGPTASGSRALLEHVESRPLTAEEVSVVFAERTAGIAAVQSQLATGILAGWRLTPDDLAPPLRSYWELFCGPVPKGEDPERYFTDELIPYRRSLIDADVVGGLEICCLGALRDDLSPGAWLEGADDKTVLGALASVPVRGGNPMALLGVMDVALYRVASEPFREIAETAAKTLLDEHLGYPEGYDGYRLFEVLADFEMHSVGLVPGAASCPGFWRRMCAWMQAGLIVRTSIVCGALPEVEQIEKWCREQQTPAGNLRRLADCRIEPLVLGHSPRFGTLRWEVALRLGQLKERHSAMGRDVPMAAEIEANLSRMRRESMDTVLSSCGPAERHVLPDAPLPEEVETLVAESWRTEEPATTLAMVARISQVFVVGSGERARVLKLVEAILNQAGTVEYSVVAGQLHAASIVAAAAGNTALANAVGAAVEACAGEVQRGPEVESLVHTLMQAAAAHRAEDEWFLWLEERLGEVAGRLPASQSECLARLFQLTECMDVALPARTWFHGRAKRLAAAGLEEAG